MNNPFNDDKDGDDDEEDGDDDEYEPGKKLIKESNQLLCSALGRQDGEATDVRKQDTHLGGYQEIRYRYDGDDDGKLTFSCLCM